LTTAAVDAQRLAQSECIVEDAVLVDQTHLSAASRLAITDNFPRLALSRDAFGVSGVADGEWIVYIGI
jgi:hypothetical protein